MALVMMPRATSVLPRAYLIGHQESPRTVLRLEQTMEGMLHRAALK